MAKQTVTVKSSKTTTRTTTTTVTSGKPKSGTQSRCPVCGKYMRKKG